MSHYIDKCKHGTVLSQCRCPSPSKTVTISPCPPTCPADDPCVDGCGQDAATIERLRAEVEHLRENREAAIEAGMAAVAAVATERDQLRHLLGSHADGHLCTCEMTDPGTPNISPPEWEQDPWCLTHPDMSVITAEVERLRERLAAVEALVEESDYHWSVVDGPDGEYVQEGSPCVSVDDLRAALAPQNPPQDAPNAPAAPGQPGRGEEGSGGRTAALCIGCGWCCQSTPRERRGEAHQGCH